MRVFVNLNTSEFVVSPTLLQRVSTLYMTRRDNVPVEVQFVRDGLVVELAGGATGKMGIKTTYGGSFLAYDSAWTKSGTGSSTIYTFGLNLNTTELTAAFPLDTEDSITAKVEIEWVADGLTSSTLPTSVVIYNDVIRGNEGTPTLATVMSNLDFSDGAGGVYRLSIDASGTLITTKIS